MRTYGDEILLEALKKDQYPSLKMEYIPEDFDINSTRYYYAYNNGTKTFDLKLCTFIYCYSLNTLHMYFNGKKEGVSDWSKEDIVHITSKNKEDAFNKCKSGYILEMNEKIEWYKKWINKGEQNKVSSESLERDNERLLRYINQLEDIKKYQFKDLPIIDGLDLIYNTLVEEIQHIIKCYDSYNKNEGYRISFSLPEDYSKILKRLDLKALLLFDTEDRMVSFKKNFKSKNMNMGVFNIKEDIKKKYDVIFVDCPKMTVRASLDTYHNLISKAKALIYLNCT